MKPDKRIIIAAAVILIVITVASLLSGCNRTGDNGVTSSDIRTTDLSGASEVPSSAFENTSSPDDETEPSSGNNTGDNTEVTTAAQSGKAQESSATEAATQTEAAPVTSEEATTLPPETKEPETETKAPETSPDTTPDTTRTELPPETSAEPPVTSCPEVSTGKPADTSVPPVTTAPEQTTPPEATSAPHVHSPEPIPAVAATCTKTGLTAGSKCSVCGQILTAQQTVPVTAHNPVQIPAVPATCTKTGLTAGSKCSVCGQILTAQQTAPKTDHVPLVSIEGAAATERTCGYTSQTSCKICGAVLSERAFQPATGYKTPELYSSDWGYKYLATLSSGASRQGFYRLLESTALEFHKSTRDADYTLANDYPQLVQMLKDAGIKVVKDLDVSSFGLTDNEISETWNMFKADHPLFYWLSSIYYRYSMNGTKKFFQLCCEDKYAQGSVRADINAKIYESVKSVHISASEKKSIYGQALSIHNSICARIEYKFLPGTQTPDDSHEAHCILGWFTDAGGVCECYAKTFQLFMNFCGYECVPVSNELHMWNVMKFDDGNWYWVDATYDDPYNLPGTTTTIYFCRNDTEDVYLNSGFIGSGNFFGTDGAHRLLPAGGADAVLPQYVKDMYGGTVNTYGECGINIVPALPARSASVYAGPKD